MYLFVFVIGLGQVRSGGRWLLMDVLTFVLSSESQSQTPGLGAWVTQTRTIGTECTERCTQIDTESQNGAIW